MSARALATVQRMRFADADDGTEPVLAASLTAGGSGADHAVVQDATSSDVTGESYRLRERTKQRLPGGLLPQAAGAMAKGGEAEHHDPASYRL